MIPKHRRSGRKAAEIAARSRRRGKFQLEEEVESVQEGVSWRYAQTACFTSGFRIWISDPIEVGEATQLRGEETIRSRMLVYPSRIFESELQLLNSASLFAAGMISIAAGTVGFFPRRKAGDLLWRSLKSPVEAAERSLLGIDMKFK